MSDSELNERNWFADGKSTEATKIVRCVIDKDFTEGWKGIGSGDCAKAAQQSRGNTRIVCNNAVDTLRLKNHLEWKRQKEIEYLRKKEAEKLEKERKQKEKVKEEKEKRRKEKEREEKLREWQEQKAREKEERKREEMILKSLEREIKDVAQTLDKEKLIREWIRLKNKQRQLESEKKAELLRKEEETKALRQTLAEISYRQWKEKTKNRRITLPKNGYQIFGPKPVPVVKEAWNHDFINGDNEDRGLTSRSARSTVSMTSMASTRGGQSQAGSRLKPAKSRTNVNDSETKSNDSTVKDLKLSDVVPDTFHDAPDFRKPSKRNETITKTVANGFTSKLSYTDALPSKTKLDIYLDVTTKPRDFKLYRDSRESSSVDLTDGVSSRVNQGTGNQAENRMRRSRSFDKSRGNSFGSRSCSTSSEQSDTKKNRTHTSKNPG